MNVYKIITLISCSLTTSVIAGTTTCEVTETPVTSSGVIFKDSFESNSSRPKTIFSSPNITLGSVQVNGVYTIVCEIPGGIEDSDQISIVDEMSSQHVSLQQEKTNFSANADKNLVISVHDLKKVKEINANFDYFCWNIEAKNAQTDLKVCINF